MNSYQPEFSLLAELLQGECDIQEQLLQLLSRERAAIVTMKSQETENLRFEKERLVYLASELEQKRSELLFKILALSSPSSNAPKNYSSDVSSRVDLTKKRPKLSEVMVKCHGSQKKVLQSRCREFKTLVSRTKELNSHNAKLLETALSIISSTLSIIRARPGCELPTYGGGGKLLGEIPDPAFSKNRRVVSTA